MENKVLEKIKNDQLQARKNKDSFKASILTTLIGEIVSIGKNAGNRETNEEETLKLISKFKKGVQDTLALIKTGDITRYKTEIEIYDVYLPNLMTNDELKEVIRKIISEGSINMGDIMKELKANYAGLYDGKIASSIIKEVL